MDTVLQQQPHETSLTQPEESAIGASGVPAEVMESGATDISPEGADPLVAPLSFSWHLRSNETVRASNLLKPEALTSKSQQLPLFRDPCPGSPGHINLALQELSYAPF